MPAHFVTARSIIALPPSGSPASTAGPLRAGPVDQRLRAGGIAGVDGRLGLLPERRLHSRDLGVTEHPVGHCDLLSNLRPLPAGEAEHALGDDVALDLAGTAGDRPA